LECPIPEPAKIGYFMLFQRKMEVLNQPYGYTMLHPTGFKSDHQRGGSSNSQVDSSGDSWILVPKSSSFSVAYDVPMSQW